MFWIRETRTWHIADGCVDEGDDTEDWTTECSETPIKVPRDDEHMTGVAGGEFPPTRDGGLICIRCAPMA